MPKKPRRKLLPYEFGLMIRALHLEPTYNRRRGLVHLQCPRELGPIQRSLMGLLAAYSGWRVEFTVGPNPKVLAQLSYSLAQLRTTTAGHLSINEYKPHRIVIETLDGMELDEGAWEVICAVLAQDFYFQAWGYQDRTFDRAALKALESNRTLPTPVSNETVTDLRILLGSCQSCDDFLNQIGARKEVAA